MARRIRRVLSRGGFNQRSRTLWYTAEFVSSAQAPVADESHKHHVGGRTVRSETTLFLRQDSHALAVLAEAASDDLQEYLAGVRYQRYAPVVAALCPILLSWGTIMMAYFHCCGISPPLQIRTTISSSLPRRAGSPLRVILNSSTETPSGRPTAFIRQQADGVCQLLHCGLNS